METASAYDVIIVGGGLAGSALAGVLARAGFGVLLIEKTTSFRERIRGELTWPWGVAEARAAGLDTWLCDPDVLAFHELRFVAQRAYAGVDFVIDPGCETPGITFSHPALQASAYAWAAAQGAHTLRPAKVTRFALHGSPCLRVETANGERAYTARLIVGADGKQSAARRWTGGRSFSDPEGLRIGGVLVTGATVDRDGVSYTLADGELVNWFAAGPNAVRLYLIMPAAQVQATDAARSFSAFIAHVEARMPLDVLSDVRQAGPLGFFSNSNTWASQVAGNGVVLIGDAAGAAEPSQGQGTSLLFHDVRHLSELLRAETKWERAITQFAAQRQSTYEVIRQYDHWHHVFYDQSAEAARLRDGFERAIAADPELGGFGLLERRGPDGLVADAAARRHYFGEDLPA